MEIGEPLMDIEAVQKALHRSRASIYRYANTDPDNPDNLNLSYNPTLLNPELRTHKGEPLRFHPNEVARFAREVLGIQEIKIEITAPPETLTNHLLQEILSELRQIRSLLEQKS